MNWVPGLWWILWLICSIHLTPPTWQISCGIERGLIQSPASGLRPWLTQSLAHSWVCVPDLSQSVFGIPLARAGFLIKHFCAWSPLYHSTFSTVWVYTFPLPFRAFWFGFSVTCNQKHEVWNRNVLLTVCPWARHLVFLIPSFLICNMELLK